MLEAAMAIVIEDAAAAQTVMGQQGNHDAPSRVAYQARQSIHRIGFPDLRSSFIRFGGLMATQFLRLDKEIDDLERQWWIQMPKPIGDDPVKFGVVQGLIPQLERIKLLATALRDEAANGMRRCNAILADGPEEIEQ